MEVVMTSHTTTMSPEEREVEAVEMRRLLKTAFDSRIPSYDFSCLHHRQGDRKRPG